ncbi:MAG: hypothetical protein K0R61_3853 [Microvirga sp.]|jgi:hypothetical protein|nr:hypothetical protein [Microvirga sp.]
MNRPQDECRPLIVVALRPEPHVDHAPLGCIIVEAGLGLG